MAVKRDSPRQPRWSGAGGWAQWTSAAVVALLAGACATRPAVPAAFPVSDSQPTVEVAAVQATPNATPTLPPNGASRATIRTTFATASPTTSEPAALALQPRPDLALLASHLVADTADLTGTYGFVIDDLSQGGRLAYNEQHVFPSASVYKLPLAVEVLRRVDAGQLQLNDTLQVTDDDADEVEPEQGLNPGDEVTVGEALRVMLEYSSNAAGHALLRMLGRPQVNAALASLGLTATHVPLLVSDGLAEPEDSSANLSAMTSPADMAMLLRRLAQGELLSEPSRTWLYGLLAYPEDYDGLADALPSNVPVLSKTGTLDDASNVAGLVMTPGGPVIISVFDEQADPGEARGFIGSLGRQVLALYSPSTDEH